MDVPAGSEALCAQLAVGENFPQQSVPKSKPRRPRLRPPPLLLPNPLPAPHHRPAAPREPEDGGRYCQAGCYIPGGQGGAQFWVQLAPQQLQLFGFPEGGASLFSMELVFFWGVIMLQEMVPFGWRYGSKGGLPETGQSSPSQQVQITSSLTRSSGAV